jgi:hypothetical protein
VVSFWKPAGKNFSSVWPWEPPFRYSYLPLSPTLEIASARRDPGILSLSRGLLVGVYALRRLALHHIDRSQALLSAGDFKLDLVSFQKNLEALLLNGREMHE